MRKLILFFIVNFYTYAIYSQTVVADPAITQLDLGNPDGVTPEFANFIAPNKVVRIKIPVFNLNQANAIPAGSCKLKINLGKYLKVDPVFTLANADLKNYFNWTSSVVSGNIEITGDVIAPIPGDFIGTALFDIKAGNILGTSEIFADFQTTNHNTTITLKDEDINNNTASLQYTVTTNPLVPVTFTGLSLLTKGCDIQVNFTTENEINVNHYEIELSKDGIHFIKLGEQPAKNFARYQYNFSLTGIYQANIVFIRIKSVDKDEKFGYSDVKKIGGNCGDNHLGLLRIYPNPYTSQNSTLVIDRDGQSIFDGLYKISLMEAGGKIIESKQLKLNNVPQINYTPRILRAGTYYLKLDNLDEITTATIKILKL